MLQHALAQRIDLPCAKKRNDRRPGGIEPLGLSAPTGLKPAPNTSQAQFGIEPVPIPIFGGTDDQHRHRNSKVVAILNLYSPS